MTTSGDSFPSTDLSPEAQWDAIPEAAKWQILIVISFLELWGEQSGADSGQDHYMRGGKPGRFPSFDLFRNTVHPVPFNLYDPFGFGKGMSEATKEVRSEANRELSDDEERSEAMMRSEATSNDQRFALLRVKRIALPLNSR